MGLRLDPAQVTRGVVHRLVPISRHAHCELPLAAERAVDPFPEHVVRFIEANIDSIEELEILRVLAESPGRAWGLPALAEQVQARSDAMGAHTAALHARGLLTRTTQDDQPSYRHGARSAELARSVDELLRVYRERPATTIRLVYERAQSALTALADAFLVRKETR